MWVVVPAQNWTNSRGNRIFVARRHPQPRGTLFPPSLSSPGSQSAWMSPLVIFFHPRWRAQCRALWSWWLHSVSKSWEGVVSPERRGRRCCPTARGPAAPIASPFTVRVIDQKQSCTVANAQGISPRAVQLATVHAVFPNLRSSRQELACPLSPTPSPISRHRGASSPSPSCSETPTPTMIHDLVAADQFRRTHRHRATTAF